MHAPGRLAPARRQDLVSGIDLPVTLLGLAGLPVPGHMLGRDLFDEGLEPAPALVATHFKNQAQRGMRTGRFKLIENLKTGTTQLFDLQTDPGETTNLFRGDREEWSDLFAEFDRLVELHEAVAIPEERVEPAPDEKTREELKSLGYVQ